MIIYGLMKFIEQIPERYDRMIGFLTLGGHRPARRRMLAACRPGTRVLDLGCGTGTFALAAAGRGATVTGLDAAVPMLEVARRRLAAAAPAVRERVNLLQGSASMLEPLLGTERFDLVTASLMLGELPPIVLDRVLAQVAAVLAPNGRFMVCDELWPEDRWRSACYRVLLAAAFVPNFIFTRTMIRPVEGLPERLRAAGFTLTGRSDFAFGVVSLLEARRTGPAGAETITAPPSVEPAVSPADAAPPPTSIDATPTATGTDAAPAVAATDAGSELVGDRAPERAPAADAAAVTASISQRDR